MTLPKYSVETCQGPPDSDLFELQADILQVPEVLAGFGRRRASAIVTSPRGAGTTSFFFIKSRLPSVALRFSDFKELMLERVVLVIWQSGIRIFLNICRGTFISAGRDITQQL